MAEVLIVSQLEASKAPNHMQGLSKNTQYMEFENEWPVLAKQS